MSRIVSFGQNLPDNRPGLSREQERQDQKKAEARQQALLQQFYASQQQRLRHLTPPHLSMDQVIQGFQASEELLPYVAPQLAHAAPVLAVGCAGKDIYTAARKEYQATQDLPKWERIKKTAAKTGDATLTQGLSYLMPLAFIPVIKKGIEKALQKPTVARWMPGIVKRRPGWTTAVLMIPVSLVTAKPMDKLINFVLDLTYRPMVEKKKREQLLKEFQEKQAFLKAQRNALQKQMPHVVMPAFNNNGMASFSPWGQGYAMPGDQRRQ